MFSETHLQVAEERELHSLQSVKWDECIIVSLNHYFAIGIVSINRHFAIPQYMVQLFCTGIEYFATVLFWNRENILPEPFSITKWKYQCTHKIKLNTNKELIKHGL